MQPRSVARAIDDRKEEGLRSDPQPFDFGSGLV
jgi:hypothetical protein